MKKIVKRVLKWGIIYPLAFSMLVSFGVGLFSNNTAEAGTASERFTETETTVTVKTVQAEFNPSADSQMLGDVQQWLEHAPAYSFTVLSVDDEGNLVYDQGKIELLGVKNIDVDKLKEHIDVNQTMWIIFDEKYPQMSDTIRGYILEELDSKELIQDKLLLEKAAIVDEDESDILFYRRFANES